MKCAICGRETAEKFHINGRCVCEECYHFFITETGVSKSMTFLNMQVSDYLRNLQEMEDAELRNSLVTALRKHAGKCSVRIPSALLDEASDAVLNGSVGQPVTSTENSVQDDGADEEADEEVILNRDVALLTTDTYPGRKIVKVFGIVTAATAVFFKIKCGFKGILSLNSITLIGPVNKTFNKLQNQAAAVGADAIIGTSYSVVQTGEGGYTVFAQGTAVKTEPED